MAACFCAGTAETTAISCTFEMCEEFLEEVYFVGKIQSTFMGMRS
jgi:hypothetical protein